LPFLTLGGAGQGRFYQPTASFGGLYVGGAAAGSKAVKNLRNPTVGTYLPVIRYSRKGLKEKKEKKTKGGFQGPGVLAGCQVGTT
jgi:hypothetical protein